MKKIVLALFIILTASAAIRTSQCKPCVRIAKPVQETTTGKGFQRIGLQDLPRPVLRMMGSSDAYAGCTFERAFADGSTFKIIVQEPDRTNRLVFINEKGEVIE